MAKRTEQAREGKGKETRKK
jgi:hypothetical protein